MPGKHRELTVDDKIAIHCFLLEHTVDGRLRRGAIGEAADKFKCERTSIWRVQKAVQNAPEGVPLNEALKCHVSTRGRKKISPEKLNTAIEPVHMQRRRTYRSLSKASRINLSTLWRAKKRGDINRCRSDPKPVLNIKNKLKRVEFSLKFTSPHPPNFSFDSMLDRVHLDEKWFYLMKTNESFLLLPHESPPPRKCKNKRFIGKVMFLAAVAKPRVDTETGEYFDGRIGLWPFVEKIPAIRSSRNRPKGTLETKPMKVTKEVYRDYLIQHVLPAIKTKMYFMKDKKIYIQQDNAKPHVPLWDEDIFEAGTSDGWNIGLENQPANSPDLNVLDLGFFNTIQALQQEECAVNLDQLIQAVTIAWNSVTQTKLFDNFITLHAVMNEIMRSDGGNDFSIPHLKKQVRRRSGNEVAQVHCDAETILKAHEFIDKARAEITSSS